MRRLVHLRVVCVVLAALAVEGCHSRGASAGIADPVEVTGPQSILVVPVRFPGSNPSRTLDQIGVKVGKVVRYVRIASYGKAWLEPTLTGWQDLPDPLSEYRISPHNFSVDRERVRRLVADALDAAGKETPLSGFAYVWIVVGAHTTPGKGYGMIAYAANPGMLSRVRNRAARLVPVELSDGGLVVKPVIVSAENAHPGHVAHDLFHAFGGAVDGERAVPDLYDFELQSNPPEGRMHPRLFAIHVGPWDIMSEHFIEWFLPPPMPSSFTRRQLGWIGPDQVVTVKPGETRELTLAPLADGRGLLAIRVPVDRRRAIMMENRQSVGADAVLPASGLLIMEIDSEGREGGGVARVVDANPGTPGLNGAPFLPGRGERRTYRNDDAGIAVIPLAIEHGGALRLVVTTPSRIKSFLPGDLH